ncbi:hypothetical protein [Aurantibacillus circumpalustris]|uniref:hypothetical protein n=1 Tax=Aurantibacillus circumpalustris TaxID=3036359 RepID=UPI00295ACAB3|nr:hypothetical protein [Aurantibacillus circumpalustris]
MKRIHLHNYEAFLLDYSEGNLNAEDSVLLKDFVLAHPELDIDLEDFSLPYLNKDSDIADFKGSLKRSANEVPDEELIDYIEGNLSKKEKLAFENKVAQDQDLARDLESYQKTLLAADTRQVYANKETLLKSEDDLILNNRLILYVENQLSESEKLQLEKEISASTELQKEIDLFSKTVLVADLSIVHSSKESLKKESRVIPLFSLRSAGSLAAAILLLFGLVGLIRFYNSNQKTGDVISMVKPPLVKETIKVIDSPKIINSKQNLADKSQIEKKNSDKITATVVEEATVIQKDSKETDQLPLIKEVIEIAKVQDQKIEEKIIPEEKQKIEIAPNTILPNSDSALSKRNYLALAEDIIENVDLSNDEIPEKNGFWKRAVKLARKANKLGVKSIDGQEDSESNFRVSFNSFSVEKK